MKRGQQFVIIAVVTVAVVLGLASAVLAQSEATFVYLESFRKGPTRITEQSMQVDLDLHNATCDIRVKDQSGKDRYTFAWKPTVRATFTSRDTS